MEPPLQLGEERGRNRLAVPRAAEQGEAGLAASSAPGAQNAARRAAAISACCALSSSKALSKEKKTDCASYRNNPSSSPLG